MRIVIHAGMHKTGSSAIQNYLGSNRHSNFLYPRWNSANHSGFFALLFQDEELLSTYHSFKNRGSEFCSQLPKLREKWHASLLEDLEKAKANNQTLIFSAEDISAPPFLAAVAHMAEFFKNWTEDIKIYAYVRSPQSYAISAFQERLKGGTITELNVQNLWPFYRKRFARLDDLFGRDQVNLKIYDRRTLVGGDVVKDFAAAIGIDISNSTTCLEANVSLSAEATALLFVQRQIGFGFSGGFPSAYALNDKFITALKSIGEGKLSFSDDLWHPVLKKNSDDLIWMEERIGMPLQDCFHHGAVSISSEEDLIVLAKKSQPALESVLFDVLSKNNYPTIEKTVSTLELLCEAIRSPLRRDKLLPSYKK